MPDFGKVVGRFVTYVTDTLDVGQTPDEAPLQGKVTFTLNVSKIIEPAASPSPVVIISTPIVAVLDSSGYLSTANPDGNTAQYQGVYLVATNDADLVPTTGLVYTVSYSLSYLQKPITIPSHQMVLPANAIIDLAAVFPPDPDPDGLPVAEAGRALQTYAAGSVRPPHVPAGNILWTGNSTDSYATAIIGDLRVITN